MKKFVIIFFTLFINSNSFAQGKESIKLVPNFLVGEIKKYTISREITFDAEDEINRENSTIKEVTIEVINVSEKEIIFNWRVEGYFFGDKTLFENPLTQLVNTLDKGFSVQYSIDKNGSNVKIINIAELAAIIQLNIKNAVIDIADKNQLEKEKSDVLLSQLIMMYATPEQIKSIILNDIFKFYQLYNFSFSPNKITKIPDSIFAETFDRLPANNLELRIISFDEKTGTLKLDGELKSTEKDKKLRAFLEKNGRVKSYYEFQLPSSWPVVFSETMTSNSDYIKINSKYQIKIIE